MEYLSDKLNSVTGNALSGINELKRKRNNKRQEAGKEGKEGTQDAEDPQQEINNALNLNAPNIYPSMKRISPSMPFGGDTFSSAAQVNPAPPIGFNVDILRTQTKANNSDETPDEETTQRQVGQPNAPANNQLSAAASDQSLYEGDAWQRLWFQRVMILSIIRLLIFIRKLYEDFHATKSYSLVGNTGHFLIAATTLFLPTIVFTIYRVARYLQVELPSTRPAIAFNDERRPRKENASSAAAADYKADSDEAHLRCALMSSTSTPTGSGNVPNQTNDDDGLVTARQSPVAVEEFHDSNSQQGHNSPVHPSSANESKSSNVDASKKGDEKRSSPGALQQVELTARETVDVNKLGNIPDKTTTRVTIGASEQLLHGVLFVFWQLKRQVDVLAYLVERSCLWRKPREQEKDELGRLRTGSDGLEWFQDFYAAFLAILAQVYTLGLHWSTNSGDGGGGGGAPLRTSTLNSALSAIGNVDSPDLAISQSARTLSGLLREQEALGGGKALGGRDLLIMSEIIVSSAVVFSLLIAVRRRDDGPLTLGLSMLGWGSIFASRIIIIALAFVHIGWKIMLALVVAHVLGISGWIYKIAIDSHNNKPGESEEHKWQLNEPSSIELEAANGTQTEPTTSITSCETNKWSAMEHVVLVAQILSLFAVPSLFYWPIMFNLKFHCRPFKYLVLIMTENFILIPAIWFTISSSAAATPGQWYLLGAVGAFSIVGFVFVSLYVSCKPSLTEYFARADELFNEAEKAGIYFEFCSRVFKMPDLSKQCFRRLMVQSEQVEEIS